jgi:hypothetical protein
LISSLSRLDSSHRVSTSAAKNGHRRRRKTHWHGGNQTLNACVKMT